MENQEQKPSEQSKNRFFGSINKRVAIIVGGITLVLTAGLVILLSVSNSKVDKSGPTDEEVREMKRLELISTVTQERFNFSFFDSLNKREHIEIYHDIDLSGINVKDIFDTSFVVSNEVVARLDLSYLPRFDHNVLESGNEIVEINLFNSDSKLLIKKVNESNSDVDLTITYENDFDKRFKLILFIDSLIRKSNAGYNDYDEYPMWLSFYSNVPHNLDIIEKYDSLKRKPYDVIGWGAFLFKDLDNIGRLVKKHKISPTYLDSYSAFRMSLNQRKVKFGLKNIYVNEYGEVIADSINYKLIEAFYDDSIQNWEIANSVKISNRAYQEYSSILEKGEINRGIYIVIFGILGLILLIRVFNFAVRIFTG